MHWRRGSHWDGWALDERPSEWAAWHNPLLVSLALLSPVAQSLIAFSFLDPLESARTRVAKLHARQMLKC